LIEWLIKGELEAIETADGICYKPDEITQFLREVRSLAEEQSVDELTNELRAIGEEIDSWKSTYNVESLENFDRALDVRICQLTIDASASK